MGEYSQGVIANSARTRRRFRRDDDDLIRHVIASSCTLAGSKAEIFRAMMFQSAFLSYHSLSDRVLLPRSTSEIVATSSGEIVKHNGVEAACNLPTIAQPCDAYAINGPDLLQFLKVAWVRANCARASNLETSRDGSIPWRITTWGSGHAAISSSDRKSNFSSCGPTR